MIDLPISATANTAQWDFDNEPVCTLLNRMVCESNYNNEQDCTVERESDAKRCELFSEYQAKVTLEA